jgi:hypothetical protein
MALKTPGEVPNRFTYEVDSIPGHASFFSLELVRIRKKVGGCNED